MNLLSDIMSILRNTFVAYELYSFFKLSRKADVEKIL